jgi:hypothetical protein
MTRTVPAAFKAVPMQMAAEMRTGSRMLMKVALGITIGGDFL